MSLFKEIYCAACGEKTTIFFRTKLKDKNYLCSKCMKKVPYYMKASVREEYSIEDYNDFISYFEYSNRELRSIFHETHNFHGIGMDAKNKLFYFGHLVDKNTLFLSFYNLAEFDMVFKPEEFKEGIIGSKVKGDIIMEIAIKKPYFKHEETLVFGAKAKAKKALFGSTIRYDNPKGMDFFIDAFASAWQESIYDMYEEYYTYEGSLNNATSSELQQAMSLFMIDNLDNVTLSGLKLHRNRLMQTFHPDAGSDADTKYAQKINTAYEVLKKCLSEN